MEHYRLHSAECWTDGPHKDAVISAIRAALKRLEAAAGPVECTDCGRRKAPGRVLVFPSRFNVPASAVPPRAA
jgi:hypothetical protein